MNSDVMIELLTLHAVSSMVRMILDFQLDGDAMVINRTIPL